MKMSPSTLRTKYLLKQKLWSKRGSKWRTNTRVFVKKVFRIWGTPPPLLCREHLQSSFWKSLQTLTNQVIVSEDLPQWSKYQNNVICSSFLKWKDWLAIAKLKPLSFYFSIFTLSTLFLSINNREMKSESGFSFAMASQPLYEYITYWLISSRIANC